MKFFSGVVPISNGFGIHYGKETNGFAGDRGCSHVLVALRPPVFFASPGNISRPFEQSKIGLLNKAGKQIALEFCPNKTI